MHLQHTYNARVHSLVCDVYNRLVFENRVDLFHECYNPNRILLLDPNGNVERGNLVKLFN